MVNHCSKKQETIKRVRVATEEKNPKSNKESDIHIIFFRKKSSDEAEYVDWSQ